MESRIAFIVILAAWLWLLDTGRASRFWRWSLSSGAVEIAAWGLCTSMASDGVLWFCSEGNAETCHYVGCGIVAGMVGSLLHWAQMKQGFCLLSQVR